MTTPKTVLVLCTGNSRRSQIAESILNHDLAGSVHAFSAATRPQQKVADEAIEALKLAGLPSEGLHPKELSSMMQEAIDLLVTVRDNAKETCPAPPRPVPRLHIPFHDPLGSRLVP